MKETLTKSSPAERDYRAEILRAAGSVFLAEGFERASVDMIAAAARMSKQSIYELFPSKIALFEAAVRSKLAGAWLNMTPVESNDSVEQALTKYARRLFEGFADPVNLGLFRANIAAANHFPELATELHDRRLEASRPLADYLEGLIASGAIRPCNPLAMAIRFGAVSVEGARYFLGAPIPSPGRRTRIIAHAVELFLRGYRQMDGGDESDPPAVVLPPALEGAAALRLPSEKLNALLDAATAEFLDHGYRRANMDRMIRNLRVSKATVYRQFGNKENLLRYIVQRDIFETSRDMFDPLTTGAGPQEALAALARQALDNHLLPANIRMHRLLVEEAEIFPDLARLFYDVRVRRLGEALTRLLEAQGLPRPGGAAVRAFYTLATFAARFFTAATLPSEAEREIYSQDAAALFLNGLAEA